MADAGFPFRPLRLVTHRLREIGVDPVAMLGAHGLPVDAEARPDDPLPLNKLSSFVTEAAQKFGDPLLGLQIAQAIPAGTYAILEFCARSAPTLRTAYEVLVSYTRIVDPSTAFDFETDAQGNGTLTHRILGETNPCAVLHETAMGFMLRMAREAVPSFTPIEITFRHRHEPKDAARAAQLLGCPVKFGMPSASVRTSAADLAKTLRSADQPLHAFLLAQAKSMAATDPSSLEQRVRQMVADRLGQTSVEAADVAKALSLSTRTLQRRLSEENTSHGAIVDDVRQTLAKRYLARDDLSVSEIAYLLGYSEVRAFDRAFRRWTGETPAAFRKKL